MARAWYLKSRPEGMPSAENFELRETALPKPDKGEMLVRNLWLSVDPYMRGRMNDVKSYVPPFALDAPMDGGAVGEVIESKAKGFAKGDLVLHMSGWRDEAIFNEKVAMKLPAGARDPQRYLGILGTTGATAYFGLLDAASAKKDDVVFISAAAGAVGSAAVQIAKAKGMTVIGSAGGAAKCKLVEGWGADAVVDYQAGPVLKGLAQALKKLGKNGIDVYFDNVGGDHLDAALALASRNARFAICGMIGGYNKTAPTKLRFIMRIIAMRIRMQGFIIFDYQPRMDEFYAAMVPWLKSGKIKAEETVAEGLENTPEAFLGLFKGANKGKMLVKL